MDLKKLFTLKKENSPELQNGKSTISPGSPVKMTFQELGAKRAGQCSASMAALTPNLHAVKIEIENQILQNEDFQQRHREEVDIKIASIEGEIKTLENNVNAAEEEVNSEEKEIGNYKEKIAHCKAHPEDVSTDRVNYAGFMIGVLILIFLSLYLWIFYTSASYSTFFKEFELNDIGIANAIFDPKALSAALDGGITELLLVCCIPFVFLALGYLIHQFNLENGKLKYLKVLGLFLVAFVFDTILAYEITEKIYNIKATNSFMDIPPYSVSMALQSVNFWLIIFAGFVSYIIWGIVFDFVMEAYAKLDKVNTLIKELEKKIKDSKSKCKDIKKKITDIKEELQKKRAELKQKQIERETRICPPLSVKLELNHFMTGWISHMDALGMPLQQQNDARLLGDNIINSITKTPEKPN